MRTKKPDVVFLYKTLFRMERVDFVKKNWSMTGFFSGLHRVVWSVMAFWGKPKKKLTEGGF